MKIPQFGAKARRSRRWQRLLTGGTPAAVGGPPTTIAGGGFPASPNGASSFHLIWTDDGQPVDSAEVTLEVVVPPTVPHLYFFALQVSFFGEVGKTGSAHLGLQWNPRFPGALAVNWGGYEVGGAMLTGTESKLPSTPADPNTRDFPWSPGRPYRLAVRPTPSSPGWWRGEVTDLTDGTTQEVRDLAAGGIRVGEPIVWSEVFARCDDPPVVVRWRDPTLLAGGVGRPLSGARVNYQSEADGGCSNTSCVTTPAGIVQMTNSARTTAAGSILAWR